MSKRWLPLEKYSSWRKIAIGMWDRPGDPTVYGFERLDMSEALPYLDQVSASAGVRISPMALVVKAIAHALATYPELNVIIINGRVMQRRDVNIFCQVAIPHSDASKADLSGVKLERVPELDLVQIAQGLRGRADRLRRGEDRDIERQKRLIDRVPRLLMRRVVRAVDLLTFNLPIDLDSLGLHSDPFGTCMVSNVGSLDIKLGFAPLVPESRCPLLLLPGALYEDVFAIDGKPQVRQAMQMSMTFDHRCYDGYQIALIAKIIRAHVQQPRAHNPAPEAFAHYRAAAESEAAVPPAQAS